MSAALGLLLVAQLTSFEFTAIPGPQTAGDSFEITIVARDPHGGIYPYNAGALLSTSRDGLWSYVSPNLVTFRNGVWQGDVVVTLAENMNLRCVEPQNLVVGESDAFDVLSGPPDRFLLILPGEEHAPGSPTGRMPGLPDNQVAGRRFELSALVTDRWYNRVQGRSDSIYFGSSDRFAEIPAGRMDDGRGTFPATVRAAGDARLVYGLPAAGSPMPADTYPSSPFRVAAGAYDRLLMLLPGETHLPGDTASQAWQTPGKEDEPEVQYLRVGFPVRVFGTDACWNRVTVDAESVELGSDFAFAAVPPQAELGPEAEFRVEFLRAGPNQNLWAGSSGGLRTYLNWLDVRARSNRLEVTAPDTVRAGETTHVRVTLRDENYAPVTAAPCRFAVVAGSGEMLDTALLSDTLGRVTARFLCTRAQGNELNTIKISADTTARIEIFVEMTDASLLEGGIVVFPNPFGLNRDRAEISYFLREVVPMTMTIHDTFGNEVRHWRFDTGVEGARAGLNRVYWDGRNSQGRRVANGIYVVQVIGERHTGTTFRSTQRIGVVW